VPIVGTRHLASEFSMMEDMMTDRTIRRVGTILVAAVAAFITWAIIRLVGVDLDGSFEEGSTRTVGPLSVVVAALVGGLAAWVVAWLLERLVQHPRRWWPFVATTGLSI
jgi:hypothetical protein